MRPRRLLTLSLVAIAALSLTACTGQGGPSDPTASASGAAAASASTSATTDPSRCENVLPEGGAADAVQVDGAFGEVPTVTTPADFTFTTMERKVVTEGDGAVPTDTDYLQVALAVYAPDGTLEASQGYTADAQTLPTQIGAGSILAQVLGCAGVGTRVVFTYPASSDTPDVHIYVIDLAGITPTRAWGADQAPKDGMPTVVLDEATGEPTVTIPSSAAPTEVQIETLKLGDGPVVQAGADVLVQYEGVKWSDGTEFDSSWSRGAPATFNTAAVVSGFQQAIEGQTVGSQVLVVVPPEFGYAGSDNELADETLVFVIDILAAATPATAAQ